MHLLLYIIIFLLPLAGKFGYFESTKVILWSLVGIILILWWIYTFFRTKRFPVSLSKLDLLYWLWLFVLLVSSLMGIHPWESIVGGSYRHQGVLFFFIFWLFYKSIGIFKDKKTLGRVLTLSLLIESLIVLYQVIFSSNLVNGRPIGSLGEANAVGGFLALGSLMVQNYVLYIFYFLVNLLTESRTAISVFLFVILGRIFIKRKVKVNKFRIILTVLLIFVSLPFIYSGFRERTNLKFEDRRLYWDIGVDMASEKPLLGYGAESIEKVYDMAFKDLEMPLYGMIIDRSHNLFLDLVLWSGIIGLMAFVLWIAFVLKQKVVENQLKDVLGIVGFFLFSLLQPLGVVHWLIFAIFIA